LQKRGQILLFLLASLIWGREVFPHHHHHHDAEICFDNGHCTELARPDEHETKDHTHDGNEDDHAPCVVKKVFVAYHPNKKTFEISAWQSLAILPSNSTFTPLANNPKTFDYQIDIITPDYSLPFLSGRLLRAPPLGIHS